MLSTLDSIKICFVLPRFSRKAIGGYKIVFEYANRLSEIGYDISILFINDYVFIEHKVPTFLKEPCSFLLTQIEPRWFKLSNKVKKISGLKNRVLLDSFDVCVATAVETVEYCVNYFPRAKKAYLIQDFEAWNVTEEEVFKTYNEGFKNIVVSRWLKELVDNHCDNPSVLISNPIDLDIYTPTVPIEKRQNHTIGLLYHSNEYKGLRYSIESLKMLKKKYPDLKVYMFGTTCPEVEVPGLVEFIKNASQEQTVRIYNKVSVFMCSTIREGYGLTGMEAMACGATLATTDYGAVREYGIEGVNCLMSPIRDAVAMADNVSRLLDDDSLRFRISNEGRKSLQTFDWKVAVNTFDNTIRSMFN